MKLRLLRHGKTEANEKRLYGGATDLPLSTMGILELKQIKSEHSFKEADLHITSGLKRAIQTLHILYEKSPDIIMSEFNEMNFGEFEMKHHDDLMSDSRYVSWLEENDTYLCPGGESRQAFKLRVLEGFSRLLYKESNGGWENVVVVAHGGVIVTIMEHLVPGERSFYEWQPKNGMGYSLLFDKGRLKEWTI